MARKKPEVTVGSGNVFRDLGLKNPEELLAKAKLATRIVQILEERQLTQAQAAKLLGVNRTTLYSRISTLEGEDR